MSSQHRTPASVCFTPSFSKIARQQRSTAATSPIIILKVESLNHHERQCHCAKDASSLCAPTPRSFADRAGPWWAAVNNTGSAPWMSKMSKRCYVHIRTVPMYLGGTEDGLKLQCFLRSRAFILLFLSYRDASAMMYLCSELSLLPNMQYE